MIKRVLAFTNPAYLSLRLGQMVIKDPAAEKSAYHTEEDKALFEKTAPIEDIGVVILDNKQVTITEGLLTELLNNNVAVISCDDRHLPNGLMLPLDGNHVQHERFMEQINASEPLRKNMWQQTVQQKIRNQAAILASVGVENKNMLKWAGDVRSGDSDNLEGRAAAYYWRNVFRDKPDFVRGRDEDYPNNLLNYGYAIVRALMARSLVAAGLLPTLGIHHHNRYNAYCLADDIMEPYRAYVDKVVLEMLPLYAPDSDLTTDMKRTLLGIPVMDVMIDGHRSPLMIAVQTTANSVMRCFAGASRKIIYPEL